MFDDCTFVLWCKTVDEALRAASASGDQVPRLFVCSTPSLPPDWLGERDAWLVSESDDPNLIIRAGILYSPSWLTVFASASDVRDSAPLRSVAAEAHQSGYACSGSAWGVTRDYVVATGWPTWPAAVEEDLRPGGSAMSWQAVAKLLYDLVPLVSVRFLPAMDNDGRAFCASIRGVAPESAVSQNPTIVFPNATSESVCDLTASTSHKSHIIAMLPKNNGVDARHRLQVLDQWEIIVCKGIAKMQTGV